MITIQLINHNEEFSKSFVITPAIGVSNQIISEEDEQYSVWSLTLTWFNLTVVISKSFHNG